MLSPAFLHRFSDGFTVRPCGLMFSLQFLISIGSFNSAIDTLPSFAVFPPRNLKFRLRVQASFHLVECVVLLQRNDLMFFSVEKWGEILKRGEARRGC